MSEIDPSGILVVDVSKDHEFIQYSKKTRAKGVILSLTLPMTKVRGF